LTSPSANGEVERFNRSLGKTIKATHVTIHNWKSELDQFIIQYHSVSHSYKNRPGWCTIQIPHKIDLPDINKSAPAI